MILVRIEAAEAGLAKALKWSAAELEKEQVRGNYKSTRARMSKMISDAKQLIKNLETKLGDHTDDSDSDDSDNKNSNDISRIVSQCTTATIKALVDMGVLTTSECRFAQTDTREPISDTRGMQKRSKTSKQSVSDKETPCNRAENRTEAQHDDFVEVVPDALKQMQKEAAEQAKRENYVDFKPIMKQYSIAIDNMENYDFNDSGTSLCKQYIVRWFNAIKIGFSKGKTRLGANKFAQTIGNIIAAVGASISGGKTDSFERSFSRWESSVMTGQSTYGYPVEVAKFVDQHKPVNGVQRLSDDAANLISFMYEDILNSKALASVTKEYDPVYLSTDLVDNIVVSCLC